jgi:hypothetical protein
MLVAITRIASQQSQPTQQTRRLVDHFLQYAAYHTDATVTFFPSTMKLEGSSDASYLSESKSRSRVASHLSCRPINPTHVNGPLDIVSSILQPVVASAYEAEYAALFVTGQHAAVLINTLQDLGHPQSAVHLNADNAPAVGTANRSTKPRRSKAIDMRFHWIQDRVAQRMFTVTWGQGATNIADFLTKAHPTAHFVKARQAYVCYPVHDSISHVTKQSKRRLEYLTVKRRL